MASVLISVIYLAFISMGLPDALLGSAWPTIYRQFGVPVSFAGLVSVLIASGTVISSLMSNRLLRRFGTGFVTVSCTILVTIGLFGFSNATAFWQLCLWALPYGLGAGSIDAALNNYVALHYKSRHMSWIHFCWGVGATVGPAMMGTLLASGQMWNAGYKTVGIVQSAMVLIMLLSLPLWKKDSAAKTDTKSHTGTVTCAKVLHMPGAKAVLLAFFCYCALESTTGLWASSYMVLYKGIPADTAAKWASFFYLGITIGRFLSGFVSDKIGDRNMVRIGQCTIAAGVVSLLLPLGNWVCLMGLILIGLGCAPVYPCLLHETPQNFGKEKSQAIMGIQMACAYTGATVMPPLFGFIAGKANIGLYPVFLILFIAVMMIMVEKMNAVSGHAVKFKIEQEMN